MQQTLLTNCDINSLRHTDFILWMFAKSFVISGEKMAGKRKPSFNVSRLFVHTNCINLTVFSCTNKGKASRPILTSVKQPSFLSCPKILPQCSLSESFRQVLPLDTTSKPVPISVKPPSFLGSPDIPLSVFFRILSPSFTSLCVL